MSYYQQSRPSRYRSTSSNNFRRRPSSRAPKAQNIHPSKFIRPATSQVAEVYIPKHKFTDFGLDKVIETNVLSMGFDTPSPIQDQAIPAGLEGRDVVGIASTGTGKTAAFALPVLQRLINDASGRVLIMAPTRELAQQIEQQCRMIAKGSGLRGAVLIGGMSMGPQVQDLRRSPQVVIGTPGRIKDHAERRTLDLAKFNIVVLDEVDRMLDMGFINDIRHILGQTNPNKQSYYFSATLDQNVRTIIDSFSKDPVRITVSSNESSANVEQDVIAFKSRTEKIDKLHDLLIKENVTKTLVFDSTHHSVERLAKELSERGFVTDAIHGGKSQPQRQRVLQKFKNSEITILVATDVAARGLDVSDITHVVNYSSPQSYEDYIHRIGRTGRAGKTGYAFTFVENY